MKQLLIITLSLMFGVHAFTQQLIKKYAIKSGIIEYKLTGNTTGSKTVYFDDFGEKYYEHLNSVSITKVFGVTDRSEIDKITIINKSHFWTIDNISGNNMEGELPYYTSSTSAYENMTEAEQKKLADDILISFGGKREGTEKILGYTCEKISVMGSFSWIYKGVVLKSETEIMGITANETAISFEKNISISASKFNAPSGIIFINMQQQKAKFSDMEMYEDEDEYEEDITPVNYAFEDFKSEIGNFNPEGYAQTMVMSQDGQHFVIYTAGAYTNIVSIIATDMANAVDEGELSNFETFNHKGKAMRYGDLSDDDREGKVLIIPFEEHNMYIILMSSPGKDKNTLLDWADQLDF